MLGQGAPDWVLFIEAVGYHYLIGADGAIYQCNKHDIYSYHAGAANGFSLGVSLIGEFMNDNLPAPAQCGRAGRLIAC